MRVHRKHEALAVNRARGSRSVLSREDRRSGRIPVDHAGIAATLQKGIDIAITGSYAQGPCGRIQIKSAATEQKRTDGRLFEDDSAARAKNGFPGPEDVPRET